MESASLLLDIDCQVLPSRPAELAGAMYKLQILLT